MSGHRHEYSVILGHRHEDFAIFGHRHDYCFFLGLGHEHWVILGHRHEEYTLLGHRHEEYTLLGHGHEHWVILGHRHIQNQPRMEYSAVYRREQPAQYQPECRARRAARRLILGDRARRYTAEYYIRGWLCIYYTLDHLNRFICYNYPV